MVRALFFALLAMCLTCLIQSSPVPDQDQQPSPLNDLEAAAVAAIRNAKDQFEKIANDPNLNKFVESASQALAAGFNATATAAADAANALREQVEKSLPKTN